MDSRERFPGNIGAMLRGHASKYPRCPNCKRRMTVKQAAPVLFSRELDEVVYGCEDCGTQEKRTVKRRKA